MLSGVLPGLGAQIKGKRRSNLLLKYSLPPSQAPGWGRVCGPSLWEPSLPYPATLTILAGVWEGGPRWKR